MAQISMPLSRASLKKGKEQNMWRGLRREVLIVDWRNTLEVQDFLPDYNQEALGKAMRAADIHVISWVGSDHREHTAMRQMRSMLPKHKALLSFSTTRVKNGRGGKVFLGKKHMADSILMINLPFSKSTVLAVSLLFSKSSSEPACSFPRTSCPSLGLKPKARPFPYPFSRALRRKRPG